MANGVASMNGRGPEGGVGAWLRAHRGWLLPIGVVAALVVAGRLVEAEAYLAVARDWVDGLGPWGPVAYVLLYVVATLLFVPGTPFTVLAALLFGVGWGFVIMMAATTLAAISGFVIARYLAKERMEARLAATDTFRRLQQMVEREHRFVIPVIRFLPVFPFSFNNYALGLTNISFLTYLVWSEAVFVVMNAVLVLGAGAIYRALVLGETSWWLLGGATAAGLLVALLGWLARRYGAEE